MWGEAIKASPHMFVSTLRKFGGWKKRSKTDMGGRR